MSTPDPTVEAGGERTVETRAIDPGHLQAAASRRRSTLRRRSRGRAGSPNATGWSSRTWTGSAWDAELFRSIPADLMLRYGFVPYRKVDDTLVIVVSDPIDLPKIDELALLLNTPIRVTVGTSSAIESILKKSEGSQRVLDEATESFELQVIHEDDRGEDSLTVERLTSDISPIIRLVDSTIYAALQRRASDIHIETGDDALYVKYRIDGVLQPAMRPIAKQFHGAIVSRIKVMAELDIAEKRIPQDGRFKVRVPGQDDRLPRVDHADGARRRRGDPHPRQGDNQRTVHAS